MYFIGLGTNMVGHEQGEQSIAGVILDRTLFHM